MCVSDVSCADDGSVPSSIAVAAKSTGHEVIVGDGEICPRAQIHDNIGITSGTRGNCPYCVGLAVYIEARTAPEDNVGAIGQGVVGIEKQDVRTTHVGVATVGITCIGS